MRDRSKVFAKLHPHSLTAPSTADTTFGLTSAKKVASVHVPPARVRAAGDRDSSQWLRMINYTESLTILMQDVVVRVPTLSFIDIGDVLVFARFGRSHAEGAFATCHSLGLPASEPGYYCWRDRASGRSTRRSEWFVTKSPVVTLGRRQMKYLMSFALPRFCDQSMERSRKVRFYGGAQPWMAKLDTV